MIFSSKIFVSIRRFLADLSFEIFLYIALAIAVLVWWQTGALYLSIAVFIAVILLLGFISYRWIDVEAEGDRKRPLRSVIWLVAIVVSGSLLMYLWQNLR